MSLLQQLASGLRSLFRKEHTERELDEELRGYLEAAATEKINAGMSSAEALRASRLDFGSREGVKENIRRSGWESVLEGFWQDLHFGFRMLRKSPGFTAAAVLTLALGIGANTAVFSLVNAILLKPLPVVEADRFVLLMTIGKWETGKKTSDSDTSPAKFALFRERSDVFQDVSSFLPGVMNYTASDVTEQWRSMRASADTFRCWRARIIRGRTFTQEEDVPNGPRVALISQSLWARKFGSDAQALGKTISLNGEPYSILGIVADITGLQEFGSSPDVYVPFQLDTNSRDEANYFKVVARLKPGISLEQANARLQASVEEYRARFGGKAGPDENFTFAAIPFREAMVGDIGPLLLVFLSAVGLVLLIACANVANLLLVRATGRQRELAVRAAIGGTKSRIVRQLITECVLLSTIGGALGLLLGYYGIRGVLSVNSADLPLIGQNGSAVNIDWRVAGFALVLSFATGVVFGLIPALQISSLDLNSVLKDNSGTSGTGFRQNRAHAALVVSETSLSFVLLVGSALLIRSFVALYEVDRGLETKSVVTMRTSLTSPQYLRTIGVTQMIHLGLERIRSLPGVVAASATCCLPLRETFGLPFKILGRPSVDRPDPEDEGGAWSLVSPGFFDVFRMPIKQGRVFTDHDDRSTAPVVVISERLAKEYWKDRNPLGDRIVITGPEFFKDEPARQIIGIVGDVRNAGLSVDPTLDMMMYVPQAQLPDIENAWVLRYAPIAWAVRTQGEPNQYSSLIRDQLQRSTGLPVSDIVLMDNIVSIRTAKQRFDMLLMTIFGFAALLLAAIGTYGLVAYALEQRTREIAIRMALGADSGRVRNMLVRHGIGLALFGIVVGIGAAWALSRFMESLLFGVKARDPMVFLTVSIILMAVALLASYIPAQRVTRVNPMRALRHE